MQKDTILQVIETMPEEVDLDELLNRLYVLDQIEEGEQSLQEQGPVSHTNVRQQFGL